MGWLYHLLSVRGASALIGTAELLIAVLIAARPFSGRLAAAGSALAVDMFLTTPSFLLSTPGVFATSPGGFPALSVLPGAIPAEERRIAECRLLVLFRVVERERGLSDRHPNPIVHEPAVGLRALRSSTKEKLRCGAHPKSRL
jgi:hypothetical protein